MNKNCIAIIPSCNEWPLLERFLPTIDLPRENILVVEQGSRDHTEKRCLELGIGCIQLQRSTSFAEAVNCAVRKALLKGAEYILIAHNDLVFETHVATQLLTRANSESVLGLVAPAQIAIEGEARHRIKRARWDLQRVFFFQESEEIGSNALEFRQEPELLESDFCEFTCALISRCVFEKVGFLDEKYQSFYADAEFCFRSQLAGFRCAYDQTAIITRFIRSTTHTDERNRISNRNRELFAQDHLRHTVRAFCPYQKDLSSFKVANESIHRYFHSYGLISSRLNDPSFSYLAHPGRMSGDYLFTVWETTKLPLAWTEEGKKYRHIFVPSLWNVEVFKQAGFPNVSILPIGIEPDIFHPWGSKISFPWEKSILCVAQNQYRKALEITLQMWEKVRPKHPSTFLLFYGIGIQPSQCLENCSFSMRLGNFTAKIDAERQIALLNPTFEKFASSSDMAVLFRSANFYLLNSRSEGFGLPVAEAMACETCCILPNYGATAEFMAEGNCLSFNGVQTAADYTDQGFTDVGDWWEPDLADLCKAVESALNLNLEQAVCIGRLGRQTILTKYTWRHSAIAFHKKLPLLQNSSLAKQIGKCCHAPFKNHKFRKIVAHFIAFAATRMHRLAIVIELHGFGKATSKVLKGIVKLFREKGSSIPRRFS